MKFLIDAQLPARLAHHLNEAGHVAIHTLDLPEQNRTTDAEIARVADTEDRIVVSKDSDFRDGHLLHGAPARVLVVSTGNITNRDLLALIDEHLHELVAAFESARLVQLTTDDLLILDEGRSTASFRGTRSVVPLLTGAAPRQRAESSAEGSSYAVSRWTEDGSSPSLLGDGCHEHHRW